MAVKEKIRISTSKKTLWLEEMEEIGEGSYGTYYRLTQRKGLKLMDRGSRKDILLEYNLMQKFSEVTIGRRRITPKVYSLMKYNVVGYDGETNEVYGIEMEHINSDGEYDDTYDAIESANTQFALHGLVYHDYNSENVLDTQKGFRIIDFTPEFIKELPSNKQGRYIVKGETLGYFPRGFVSKKLDIRGECGGDSFDDDSDMSGTPYSDSDYSRT
jgi:hypothetical protein